MIKKLAKSNCLITKLFSFSYCMLFVSSLGTVRFLCCLADICMWCSRLRATFLSNRDEVDMCDESTITHKTGFDRNRLLPAGLYCILFIYPFFKFSYFVFTHN